MKLRQQNGFLLVEVLVAVVVIAITVIVLLSGMRAALKMTARSEGFTENSLRTEALLFEMQAGERMDLIENGGFVEAGEREFEIKREIVLPKDVAVEEEYGAVIAPSYRLSIATPDDASVSFNTGEIYLARELFS